MKGEVFGGKQAVEPTTQPLQIEAKATCSCTGE